MNTETYRPIVLSLLRIIVAYNFLLHGTAKLFGLPHIAMFDGMPLFSLMGAAGILEVVGGILLLLGLLTRATSFVLSGMMAVAYFMAHAFPQGNLLLPLLNGGEPAVLFCFVFLYLSVAGGGSLSLDAKLAK